MSTNISHMKNVDTTSYTLYGRSRPILRLRVIFKSVVFIIRCKKLLFNKNK
jgi:hypothetical protein